MSHSKIYQVCIRPIEKDNYAEPSDYWDNSGDFADYIGDPNEGEERKESIRHLAELLSDIFDLDEENDALVYKGYGGFLKAWTDAIKQQAAAIEDGVIDGTKFATLVQTIEETHLHSSYRFDIKDWNNGCPDSLDDLIGYVKGYMNPGDRLYVGAVIDYHF